MAWRSVILAALGLLLLMGSPAAAGIHKVVDSRGVLVIRNTGAPTSAPQVNPETQVQAPEAPPEAAADPPAAPVETHSVQAVNPPTDPPPAAPVEAPALRAVNVPANAPPGPPAETAAAAIQAVSQIEPQALAGNAPVPAAAAPEATQKEAESPASGPAAGPERPEPPLQNSAPLIQSLAAQFPWTAAAPAPVKPLSVEGIVRSYRDSRGVIHITNCEPQSEPAPVREPAPGDRGAPSLARNNRDAPAVKLASYSDSAAGGLLPGTQAPKAAAPGAIRRYRDAKGVWHIENAGPENREAAPAPKLVRSAVNRKQIEIFGPDGTPVAPVRPASLPAAPAALGPAIREIPPEKADMLAEGSIRRYRDAKGVLHIKTVEPVKPEVLPAPVLLARPGPRPPNMTALSPAAKAPPQMALPGPPAGSGVVAFRDRQGRLTIRNQDPGALAAANIPRQEMALVQLAPILQEASALYGLPVSLIQAVVRVESNFVTWAVSPKGAMGLMQLMPGTAEFLGVRDPFDPRENIHGGCRYLRLLLDFFGGSLPLALAAYNAGYQRVIDCGLQIPNIKETQDFVTQVLGRYFTAEKRGRSPWT
jgi:hypothetical protein